MGEKVRVDRWGYEVNTTSDSCIDAINAYYYQVLTYGRERRVILEAPQHDKDCVLGNILAAHALAASDRPRAKFHAEAAAFRLEQATAYEKAVFDAVSYLISENRDDDAAFELHAKLLKVFPNDLSSLKRAQILCFYMGRPDLSLDLVQQVLRENHEKDFVYGMLAFPLLEIGKMGEAEEAAKKGYEINEKDYWAQHCLCHVLQYQCRFKEAVEFMEACSLSWSSCSSFLYTHNWWHVALCYLEGHSPIFKVLEIYENCIWKELEKPDAVEAEVYLNALGLLLRLQTRGKLDVFVDHLMALVECLNNQKYWYIEWHLDLLIIWAFAKTGEVSQSLKLLDGLKFRTTKMNEKKRQAMQKGIKLAEAMHEYGKGNEVRALELLGPDFEASDYKMIGASDEQLDVFNEIWLTLLLSTGKATEAAKAIDGTVKKRDGVPFLWRLLEKAYAMADMREEESRVRGKANALESAYFS